MVSTKDKGEDKSVPKNGSSTKSHLRSVTNFCKRRLPFLLFHVACLLVHLLPIVQSPLNTGKPVLDEFHMVSKDNNDVNGQSDLRTIFTNDYWGRPMNAPSSHKSWRPLSVLSFRYLKGGRWFEPLACHRFVNVITHAAIGEMVAILAVKMIPPKLTDPTLLHVIVKSLWMIHPTHIEATVNAANRPHLFAILCSLLAADPDTHILLFLLALVVGYLSCETFMFQVLSAIVTLTVISYVRRYHKRPAKDENHTFTQQIWVILKHPPVFLRITVLVISSVMYYSLRYYFNTLSIPRGLIRPAENPFFEFQGLHRLRNYLYVTAIHVAKVWDLDFIGFSHEYGRECIKPLMLWNDVRLLIPLVTAWLYLLLCGIFVIRAWRKPVIPVGSLLLLVHLAWLFTLFPIAGIVKVGTFIADRIAVAATVSVSIILGYVLTSFVREGELSLSPAASITRKRQRMLALVILGLLQCKRIYKRSAEWLDSVPLLESSLRTCPNFAKAHMELSKVHSGLYPEKINLTKSRWHLQRAASIDPDFCDVHLQVAHVSAQEHKYIEMEEHLVKALQCQYTSSQSIQMWQEYWRIALNENTQTTTTQHHAAALERYQKYMTTLQAVLEKERLQAEQTRPQSLSPFALWDES